MPKTNITCIIGLTPIPQKCFTCVFGQAPTPNKKYYCVIGLAPIPKTKISCVIDQALVLDTNITCIIGWAPTPKKKRLLAYSVGHFFFWPALLLLVGVPCAAPFGRLAPDFN